MQEVVEEFFIGASINATERQRIALKDLNEHNEADSHYAEGYFYYFKQNYSYSPASIAGILLFLQLFIFANFNLTIIYMGIGVFVSVLILIYFILYFLLHLMPYLDYHRNNKDFLERGFFTPQMQGLNGNSILTLIFTLTSFIDYPVTYIMLSDKELHIFASSEASKDIPPLPEKLQMLLDRIDLQYGERLPVLQYLYQMLDSGLADNLKEAELLYMQHAHNMEIKSLQEEQVRLQAAQLAHTKRIIREQEWTQHEIRRLRRMSKK